MTVGSWEPGSEKTHIPVTALKSAINYTDEHSFPTEPGEQLLSLQPFVKVNKEVWQEVFEHFSSSDLKNLCRFFTLAEAKWQDWFGGEKNPVVWICKELKTRGDFPDKELTAWIKAHTENRFLPYGNVFG